MVQFTPYSALLGGLLIGASSVLLLAVNGRIAGISGIVGGCLMRPGGDIAWRIAFVVGLVLAPIAWGAATGDLPDVTLAASPALIVVGGLLVGFGARLGSGCTSGHGVCGVARLSRRSFAATGVFMATAIATVFVMRHVLGG